MVALKKAVISEMILSISLVVESYDLVVVKSLCLERSLQTLTEMIKSILWPVTVSAAWMLLIFEKEKRKKRRRQLYSYY